MRTPARSALLSVGLLFIAGHSAATTVFNDPFDVSTAGNQNDINFEQAARQAGGTTTSSYTGSTAGSGSNTQLINANQNLNGNDDVLLLRTFNTSSASQSAVDLDTNFGPSLANQLYTISFDWYSARSSTTQTDTWVAISLGDGASGVTGPNNASADMGLLLRIANTTAPSAQVWRDNSNTGGALGTFTDDSDAGTDGWGDRFNVVITIDETAGIGSSTVSVTTTAYTSDAATTLDLATQTDLGPLGFDFENATNRFLELRAHQGGTGTDGTLHDARFDNLTITLIPEPSSLVLLGLGGLLVARRRRLGPRH